MHRRVDHWRGRCVLCGVAAELGREVLVVERPQLLGARRGEVAKRGEQRIGRRVITVARPRLKGFFDPAGDARVVRRDDLRSVVPVDLVAVCHARRVASTVTGASQLGAGSGA